MKRKIGTTSLEVFPIGLGGMPLSIQGRPSEGDALRVIHASVGAGVNFIDTANVYCLDDNDIGHNERLIHKALKEMKALNKVIVATKGGLTRPHGEWECDASPKHLRLSCEKSLKALDVETITLYQLHAPDSKVPFEDSVGELARLKKEGKIIHVGLSNVSEKQLNIAQKIVRIETVQNRCSAAYKNDFNNGLIGTCKKQNITYLPYSPLGGHFGHKNLSKNPILTKLAQKYKTSTYCIVLAWFLQKGDHIIPIPGASRIASATDSPQAAYLKLDKEDCSLIDQL